MAKTNYSPTFPMYPGSAFAITPNNSADLANVAVVYVGGSGNVLVTTAQGDDVIFSNLLAGTVIPVQVMKVWSTSTTATNLIGIY